MGIRGLFDKFEKLGIKDIVLIFSKHDDTIPSFLKRNMALKFMFMKILGMTKNISLQSNLIYGGNI